MTWPDAPLLLALDAPPAPGRPEEEVLQPGSPEARVIVGVEDEAAEIGRADILLTWRRAVDAALLERAARCRLVLHYGPGAGAGVGRVDRDAARRLGIYVASIPDYAAEEWAEGMWELNAALEARRPPAPPFRRRPRVGLIGLGQVGRRLAERWKRAAGEIWAHDPYVDDDVFERAGARRAELTDVFGICDQVLIQLSPAPGATGLIGRDMLELMRPWGQVVCGSRPEVFVETELRWMLERGRPGGLGVLEPMLAGAAAWDWLRARERVVVHAFGEELNRRMWRSGRRRAAEVVLTMLRGGRPGHLLIDPPCPRHEMWG